MSIMKHEKMISPRVSGGGRTLLLLILLAALTGCSGTSSFFFYPQSRWFSTPEDVAQPYKNIILTAADGTRLHSWWLAGQNKSPDTVILYLHGNAQNISTHSHSIYWLAQEGYDVLALDYRGFGASQGEAQMPDILQDIEAATRWIRYHYPEKKLIILGQSIGAALAVNFTAKASVRYNIEGLILDAPFAAFPQAARDVTSKSFIGWFIYPFTILVPSRWDPVDLAGHIKIPTLIMHSQEDPVIPYERGRRVFDALPPLSEGRHCWLESRGGHIASFKYEDIRQQTLSFIENGECAGD